MYDAFRAVFKDVYSSSQVAGFSVPVGATVLVLPMNLAPQQRIPKLFTIYRHCHLEISQTTSTTSH